MSVTIEFSTSRYERLHGRKPRGYGLWYFRMPDGRTFVPRILLRVSANGNGAGAADRHRHGDARAGLRLTVGKPRLCRAVTEPS